MRAHTWLSISLLIAASMACGSSPRREYTLQGQILSVSSDGMEARIKHEEIKGFMAAMTMPYKVREPGQLTGLKPGDLISSTLVIVSNDAYLEHVRKVGEAPLEQPVPQPAATSGFELLKPGEPVPNAAFVDQDGNAREFGSFKGAPVVVTFIYTQCPLPTFCPLMDRHFKTIQDAIVADPGLKRVQLVSVSFDPITDTPAVLKAHAARVGANRQHWTFLTGDRDEIDKFAMRFGVSIARDTNNSLEIAHNLRTAIVDARGMLVKSYTGNEWTPEQVLADLKVIVYRGGR